jgi:hypothetical protein
VWSSWWNENWRGKPKYSEKAWSSATLSTIYSTRPDLESNPDRHGGMLMTNCLSYDTAFSSVTETCTVLLLLSWLIFDVRIWLSHKMVKVSSLARNSSCDLGSILDSISILCFTLMHSHFWLTTHCEVITRAFKIPPSP